MEKTNRIEIYIYICFFSRGCLWSCGLNNYHQLGHPGVTKLLVPTKVKWNFTQSKNLFIMYIILGTISTDQR